MPRSMRATSEACATLLTRRDALRLAGAAGLLAAAGPAWPQSNAPSRIAVFDWGLAETLLALGAEPMAVAETSGYRDWVIEPALPPTVTDVGLRLEPNLELLARLRPDLMLMTPEIEPLRPMLERIGRTETLAIYRQGGNIWDLAVAAANAMAGMIGREAESQALLGRVNETIEVARARIGGGEQRPLYLVNFIDRRHVRVYGAGSIFQTVLDRLGIPNAYTGWTTYWGFATFGIEHLAANPEARLAYFEPVPEPAERMFAESPLWAALPFTREKRITGLPQVWSFGGLASAERFARLLGERLSANARTAGGAK